MSSFYVPGDLVLNDDGTDVADDGTALETVKQDLINTLTTASESYRYDLNFGTRLDWLTSDMSVRLGLQRQELREKMLSVTGVTAVELLVLRFDGEGRILYVDYRLRTIYGILADVFGVQVA